MPCLGQGPTPSASRIYPVRINGTIYSSFVNPPPPSNAEQISRASANGSNNFHVCGATLLLDGVTEAVVASGAAAAAAAAVAVRAL